MLSQENVSAQHVALRNEGSESAVSQGILFLPAWQLIAGQKACQSPRAPLRPFSGFLIDAPPIPPGTVAERVAGARHCGARCRRAVSARVIFRGRGRRAKAEARMGRHGGLPLHPTDPASPNSVGAGTLPTPFAVSHRPVAQACRGGAPVPAPVTDRPTTAQS